MRETTLGTLVSMTEPLGRLQLRLLNKIVRHLSTRAFWAEYETKITTPLTGVGSPYLLTGLRHGAALRHDKYHQPHVYADGNRALVYLDSVEFELDSAAATGTVTNAVLFNRTASGITASVSPATATGTLTTYWYNAPADVALDADVVLLPADVVEAFLYAASISERGEDGGTSAKEAQQDAELILFAHLAASSTTRAGGNRVIV